ncbi:FAD-dependent oxidoreductase [Paenibacillus crassostreae]|uniref:FAD-dependent oxidoreductase n=1 Tax=Paenibacillus crassostreae TaxID=1763538 RepID=UPI003CE5AE8B
MNSFTKFVENNVIAVDSENETIQLTALPIFINTGAITSIPPIDGVQLQGVYTSKTLFNQQKLPKSLAIIGGGYIGLEYTSMYHRFGII